MLTDCLCALAETNFFERRVSEYQKAGVMNSKSLEANSADSVITNVFSTDVDF
jgi:hypothetical protein